MAPITLGSGEPVPAPEPGPVRRGLLAAATEIPSPGAEWVGGFTWDPFSCAAVDPQPIECVWGDADKPVPANSALGAYQPFAVFGAYQCSLLDRGVDGGARARQNLTATESWQAAREWWSGVASQAADETPPNHYLTDGTADVVGSGALNPVLALALLEADLAACLHNARGMIHASPATVAVWDNAGVVRVEGGLLVTAMDTIVVADGAYDGSSPDGDAVNLAETAWAYGTGLVYYRRGPVTPVGDEGVTIDRGKNTRLTMVERAMAVVMAGCCTLAVEVDMAVAGSGGGSGGGDVDGGSP